VKSAMARMMQSSHIDRLLQSLVKSMQIVPDDADVVHDSRELPSSWLQNVVISASDAGHGWRCWMDCRLHVWLFVARLSLPLSRELGSPVLRVDFYRESGLSETANWGIDRRSRWRRAPVDAGEKGEHDVNDDEPSLTAIDFYRPDDIRS
jgi:hypothetical protein